MSLAEPTTFAENSRAVPVSDLDRENGLYVLESWEVEGSPIFATLAVQRYPGDTAPVVSMPFDETLQRDAVEWGIRASGNGDDAPMPGHVYAFTRSGDYLIVVSGERFVVDELLDALDVKVLVQP